MNRVEISRTGLVNALKRCIVTLPVVVPAAIAIFSVVAMIFLIVDAFNVAIVCIVGALFSVLVAIATHRAVVRYDFPSRSGVVDSIAIVFVLLWVVGNVVFASQHIFTNRDPATYNNAAFWLTTHESLKIEKPSALSQLGLDNLDSQSLGFATNPNDTNQLVAQGAHLLPAAQAIAGKSIGYKAIFGVNVVLTGFALLSFYGFARMYLRRGWALIGLFVLAMSLPYIFVARDAYSESLAMLFIFGGLSLLKLAYKSGQLYLWIFSGLVMGVSALARIDALLTFSGVMVGLAALVAVTRRAQAKHAIGMMVFVLAIIAIGWLAFLDLRLLSKPYFEAHQGLIYAEFFVLLGTLAVALLLIAVAVRTNLLKWARRRVSRRFAIALGAIVAIVYVALLLRPFWLVGFKARADGVIVQTFSEQTLNWVLWYFGPVVLIGAIVGLCLLVVRMWNGTHRLLLPFLGAFMSTAAVYILEPSITGDQPWASRRFVPMIFPGFVFLTLWILNNLWDKKVIQLRNNKIDTHVVGAVLLTLMVVSPLVVSYPFLIRKLYAAELQQVTSVCAVIPQDTSIVWLGQSRYFSTQPVSSVCGIDSMHINHDGVTQEELRELQTVAMQKNQSLVVGFYAEDAENLPLRDDGGQYSVSAISYHEIDHSYKRAPRNVITLQREILVGELSDGTIIPLQK